VGRAPSRRRCRDEYRTRGVPSISELKEPELGLELARGVKP
jgi:hypothetical protein